MTQKQSKGNGLEFRDNGEIITKFEMGLTLIYLITSQRFNLILKGVYTLVQFYPLFSFCFPLFYTHSCITIHKNKETEN